MRSKIYDEEALLQEKIKKAEASKKAIYTIGIENIHSSAAYFSEYVKASYKMKKKKMLMYSHIDFSLQFV